jgi:hypothetical protein
MLYLVKRNDDDDDDDDMMMMITITIWGNGLQMWRVATNILN